MVAVAIANQKGGVGKTTVTLGLAQTATNFGLKVLVVDCDPQANATAGLDDISDSKYSLAEVLEQEKILNIDEIYEYGFRSPWSSTDGNSSIDVIRSNSRLSNIESHLASDPIGSFDRLEMAISKIKDQYDLILFDCPPSVGLITINALFAADEVIIVSAPSAWSVDGVDSFVNNIERIRKRRDGKPNIAGIVINNVGRTRDAKYWQNDIENRFGISSLSVPARAAIAESCAMSVPLANMGARPGAKEALSNFSEIFSQFIGLTVDDSQSAKLDSVSVI
ncbi:MAG: AAA family ATPase [Acidimicrobiia bacterium]